MTQERTVRGSYEKVTDLFRLLGPEYNHLEIKLRDLKLDNDISEKTSMPYANVEEIYSFNNHKLYDEDGALIASTQVHVFNGPYALDKKWRPVNIKMNVDGHSYVDVEKLKSWPNYFVDIKTRVLTLIGFGYSIQEFEAMKNQRDDFPGDIDAEEILKVYANR